MVALLVGRGLGRSGSLVLSVGGSGECEMVTLVRLSFLVVTWVLVLFGVPADMRIVLAVGF